MNIFRKFHFLSVLFILFTFLSFSGYAHQTLPLNGQLAGKGDVKINLLQSISSEFLLPGIDRVQNIQVLPVLKCFPERQSFTGLQKTLPVSKIINNLLIVSIASNSFLLEEICKLQI